MSTRYIALNDVLISTYNQVNDKTPDFVRLEVSDDNHVLIYPDDDASHGGEPINDGLIALADNLRLPSRYFTATLRDDGSICLSPCTKKPKKFTPSALLLTKPPKQRNAPTPQIDDIPSETMEEMAERLEKAWFSPATPQATAPSPRPTNLQPILPTAKIVSEKPMGNKRMLNRTIAVPVSFDKRKQLGERRVEVVVRRRRSLAIPTA